MAIWYSSGNHIVDVMAEIICSNDSAEAPQYGIHQRVVWMSFDGLLYCDTIALYFLFSYQ